MEGAILYWERLLRVAETTATATESALGFLRNTPNCSGQTVDSFGDSGSTLRHMRLTIEFKAVAVSYKNWAFLG